MSFVLGFLIGGFIGFCLGVISMAKFVVGEWRKKREEKIKNNG